MRPIPGSGPLPQRTRSEAPSLRRHYPASTVLWASPTPHAARPVPRGRPVGSRSHRLGSPVLRAFSLCRHAIATTPAGSSQGSGCSLDFDDGGLPQMSAGSAPAVKSFRGLLGVHACYGLPARGVANATLSIEGFGSIVTSTTAPIATGWSNSCQVGIAPTEERRLCTAHGHSGFFFTKKTSLFATPASWFQRPALWVQARFQAELLRGAFNPIRSPIGHATFDAPPWRDQLELCVRRLNMLQPVRVPGNRSRVKPRVQGRL